jgi:hypothetical protein
MSGVHNTAQAVLDINVLDLIDGTRIRADEIYGVEVTIYNVAGTREAYIYVNGVQSTRFVTVNPLPDTPTNYQLPRTRENTLTYMNPTGGAFVSADADTFDVRIRANNQRYAVTAISLLGADGEVLGTSEFVPTNSIEGVTHDLLLGGSCLALTHSRWTLTTTVFGTAMKILTRMV